MKKERVFIDGDRIYLRKLEKSDVHNNYIHWFDDAEVCKYSYHHAFPYSDEELEDYVESLKQKSKIVLAIIEKSTGNHVGNLSLQDIDVIANRAELAIVVGEKSVWGLGYGKEACALIVEHGFQTLNLNSIACFTPVLNIGMQKIAESLKFTKEGTIREMMYKNGEYLDVFVYGLLKREWKENQSK